MDNLIVNPFAQVVDGTMRAWTLKKMREYLGAEEPTLTGASHMLTLARRH
jgi:hypothetical protein